MKKIQNTTPQRLPKHTGKCIANVMNLKCFIRRMKMTGLTDKITLITGAGTGIGQAIAVRLAQEGAKVLVVGRTEKTLQETTALHENISYLVADIEQDSNLQKIVQKLNELGGLDILVNNAGWAPVTPISSVKIDEYDKVFSINVRALVNLTLHCLPILKVRKDR